jgi:hypothetical protein
VSKNPLERELSLRLHGMATDPLKLMHAVRVLDHRYALAVAGRGELEPEVQARGADGA